jgi:hypothetical protein
MFTNHKLALISNDSSRWSKYLREKLLAAVQALRIDTILFNSRDVQYDVKLQLRKGDRNELRTTRS